MPRIIKWKSLRRHWIKQEAEKSWFLIRTVTVNPVATKRNPMRVPFSNPIGRKKGRWKTVECRSRDTCRPLSNWNLDLFFVIYVGYASGTESVWYPWMLNGHEQILLAGQSGYTLTGSRDRIKEPFRSFVNSGTQLC